jgi:hypothetical protein
MYIDLPVCAIVFLCSVNCLVILPGKTNRLNCAVVTLYTTGFEIKKFHPLPTQWIYVFCVDLRTNSDYFPIQH